MATHDVYLKIETIPGYSVAADPIPARLHAQHGSRGRHDSRRRGQRPAVDGAHLSGISRLALSGAEIGSATAINAIKQQAA